MERPPHGGGETDAQGGEGSSSSHAPLDDRRHSPQLHLVARPPRDERPCRLIEWKPWPFDSASLIGNCAVSFSGWVVHQVPVFRKADGSLSIGTPNAAQLEGDGRVKVRDGKRQYSAVMTFETIDARERWRRMVLAALAAGGIVGGPGR